VLVVLLPLWQLLAVWVVVLVLLAGLDQLLELVRVALLAEWPEPLAVQVWVVLVVPLRPKQILVAWEVVLVLVAGLDQVPEIVCVVLSQRTRMASQL
jgi:hypothetical protein